MESTSDDVESSTYNMEVEDIVDSGKVHRCHKHSDEMLTSGVSQICMQLQ